MPNNRLNQPMYIRSGDPESENLPVSSDLYPAMMGGEVTVEQPGPASPGAPGLEQGAAKTYKRVIVDSTVAVEPTVGALAYWSDRRTYKVTTDWNYNTGGSGRGQVAGIFQNVINKGNIGFIQVEGPATVKFLDTPTANPDDTGLIVIPSSTPGKADCLAAGSAATYPEIGRSAGPFRADKTAIVQVNIPRLP